MELLIKIIYRYKSINEKNDYRRLIRKTVSETLDPIPSKLKPESVKFARNIKNVAKNNVEVEYIKLHYNML